MKLIIQVPVLKINLCLFIVIGNIKYYLKLRLVASIFIYFCKLYFDEIINLKQKHF
jgi:hypothetical protein